jgi:hypothetical protein
MSTRAFGSARATKRRARRSFSDTIAAPSPSPWNARATAPSAKTSVNGGSASTLSKPQSCSPSGDSTTAKSRSRSTPGAVQRPRSQSASVTRTPMSATHSSFAKAVFRREAAVSRRAPARRPIQERRWSVHAPASPKSGSATIRQARQPRLVTSEVVAQDQADARSVERSDNTTAAPGTVGSWLRPSHTVGRAGETRKSSSSHEPQVSGCSIGASGSRSTTGRASHSSGST